jgi:hypothetical protein
MAKSISVALADRDTMLTGLALSVTAPLDPDTVTGQCATAGVEEPLAAAEDELDPPQAVRGRSSARNSAESADQRGTGGVRDTEKPPEEAEDIAHEPTRLHARPLPRGSVT